ncbi:hypothetical protein K438DRAFT_807763 [Mycena galopus ATCC 62051]|nr:hypothetical protein K438DRAFT_807763 [Mycena galopus ATCC 62051]
MPPQTRRARTDASERTPPAPTNPLATRTTRGNLRHTATPQGEASQPTRASGSSSADNSRGFAPLASQSNRGSGSGTVDF